MVTRDEQKRSVGRLAAELVRDGMTVGLGTGSTANHLIDRLGERLRDGLRIRAVPTSDRTAERARALGIPLIALDDVPYLDLAIDGADQVDPRGDLIKGLGGALYREKRVAHAAREFAVIVDDTKLVDHLGAPCPVPVEVETHSVRDVAEALSRLGSTPRIREAGGRTYLTDNGHPILDALFDRIDEPADLEREINAIPGVVENGLFARVATRVLVAAPEGIRDWRL